MPKPVARAQPSPKRQRCSSSHVRSIRLRPSSFASKELYRSGCASQPTEAVQVLGGHQRSRPRSGDSAYAPFRLHVFNPRPTPRENPIEWGGHRERRLPTCRMSYPMQLSRCSFMHLTLASRPNSGMTKRHRRSLNHELSETTRCQSYTGTPRNQLFGAGCAWPSLLGKKKTDQTSFRPQANREPEPVIDKSIATRKGSHQDGQGARSAGLDLHPEHAPR